MGATERVRERGVTVNESSREFAESPSGVPPWASGTHRIGRRRPVHTPASRPGSRIAEPIRHEAGADRIGNIPDRSRVVLFLL